MTKNNNNHVYSKFSKIDGTHPWRDVSPEGYVDYPVRHRKGGKVIFFNFTLARDMGLIPKNHPNKLNSKLREAILKTFSIQILNEHDWMNKRSLPKDGLEDRLYMATRYLQGQHESKQGKTSGDGRSIWNGYLRNRTKTFDISSCGTGSTILSPGVSEAGKHIKTGSENYGYSSGLADLDEMLGGAIMSEIFYREGYPTERSLTVIEYKDKSGIGVRTAPNLIRPAHIYRYLKSGEWKELQDSFEYFIKRQEENGTWKLSKFGQKRYDGVLEYLTRVYAKLAAVMEEEYIFNWLAWDGDNILATGAILDYGSIRQFAARHDKYRYEDVDRFSTSLSEQRFWARYLIQTFVQVVDFILTKEKRPLESFDQSRFLRYFDKRFLLERQSRMLWRMGFTPNQIKYLKEEHQQDIQSFRKVLNYFEQMKTVKGEKKVPDGIDHPPVFLVRHILRELPLYILKKHKKGIWPQMPAEEFCKIMAASYVNREDLKLTDYRIQMAYEFQQLYHKLIKTIGSNQKATLKVMVKRSLVVNYEFRRTGDGLTWITNEAIAMRNRIQQNQLMAAIERFIESQVLIPGRWNPIRASELNGKSMKTRLLRKMQENLEIYNENI